MAQPQNIRVESIVNVLQDLWPFVKGFAQYGGCAKLFLKLKFSYSPFLERAVLAEQRSASAKAAVMRWAGVFGLFDTPM